MVGLLLLLLSSAPAGPFDDVPETALVDRVVATVDRDLVLASEIVLGRELAALDPGPLPFWSRSVDPTEQRIDATLIRTAASDIALYQPTSNEVANRLETVRAAFVDRHAWESFLGRHGLDELTLSEELKRRMVVERFLARNLTVDPTDRRAWFAAVEGLVEGLRPRYRIRRIPLEAPREPEAL